MTRCRAMAASTALWVCLAWGSDPASVMLGPRSASAAAAPASGSCVPRLTQAHWLAPQGSASARIQVTWHWSPPAGDGAALRLLVTDMANADPATNHGFDPQALSAAASTGDTLDWYPTTAHRVQVVASQPDSPCNGAASAEAPVAFTAAPPARTPTTGLTLQAAATPSGVPSRTLAGTTAEAGSGGACSGLVCAPTFPDLGQALSGAIVSGLMTLLTNAVTALSDLLRSLITWATAGSRCAASGASSSPFTLLSGTPPCLSWTNPYVQQYAALTRTIALSLIALLVCLHGLEIALATRAARTFDGALDVLRRLALAAVLGSVLVGTSGGDGLFGTLLSLANTITAAVGVDSLPAVPPSAAGASLESALVGLLYLVMELILIVQLLMRLALLDLLMVVAPLAVLCYAYPRWAHWATHWAQLTASTVLLQFLQVTALVVSTHMVASLDVSSASALSTTLLQMLLGIAGLVLVVRLPRLLYGLGGVLAGGLPFALAQGSSPAGPATSLADGGGRTTVTPAEGRQGRAALGASDGLAALPSAGGPHGGAGAGGPLYAGGGAGGTDLTPMAGADAAFHGPAGDANAADDGAAPWGSVTITEVPPLALPPAPGGENGGAPSLSAGGSGGAGTPPGGWP